MLDVPVMGVNAPKEHQRVIAIITSELYWLYKNGLIGYEPLPEVMVDESQTSPTPDIVLFDNDTYLNQVIIEVTIPPSFKSDCEKVEALLEKYDITEGFVYDYKRHVWKKYKYGIGEITENPSFCDSIGYDLNSFLSK